MAPSSGGMQGRTTRFPFGVPRLSGAIEDDQLSVFFRSLTPEERARLLRIDRNALQRELHVPRDLTNAAFYALETNHSYGTKPDVVPPPTVHSTLANLNGLHFYIEHEEVEVEGEGMRTVGEYGIHQRRMLDDTRTQPGLSRVNAMPHIKVVSDLANPFSSVFMTKHYERPVRRSQRDSKDNRPEVPGEVEPAFTYRKGWDARDMVFKLRLFVNATGTTPEARGGDAERSSKEERAAERPLLLLHDPLLPHDPPHLLAEWQFSQSELLLALEAIPTEQYQFPNSVCVHPPFQQSSSDICSSFFAGVTCAGGLGEDEPHFQVHQESVSGGSKLVLKRLEFCIRWADLDPHISFERAERIPSSSSSSPLDGPGLNIGATLSGLEEQLLLTRDGKRELAMLTAESSTVQGATLVDLRRAAEMFRPLQSQLDGLIAKQAPSSNPATVGITTNGLSLFDPKAMDLVGTEFADNERRALDAWRQLRRLKSKLETADSDLALVEDDLGERDESGEEQGADGAGRRFDPDFYGLESLLAKARRSPSMSRFRKAFDQRVLKQLIDTRDQKLLLEGHDPRNPDEFGTHPQEKHRVAAREVVERLKADVDGALNAFQREKLEGEQATGRQEEAFKARLREIHDALAAAEDGAPASVPALTRDRQRVQEALAELERNKQRVADTKGRQQRQLQYQVEIVRCVFQAGALQEQLKNAKSLMLKCRQLETQRLALLTPTCHLLLAAIAKGMLEAVEQERRQREARREAEAAEAAHARKQDEAREKREARRAEKEKKEKKKEGPKGEEEWTEEEEGRLAALVSHYLPGREHLDWKDFFEDAKKAAEADRFDLAPLRRGGELRPTVQLTRRWCLPGPSGLSLETRWRRARAAEAEERAKAEAEAAAAEAARRAREEAARGGAPRTTRAPSPFRAPAGGRAAGLRAGLARREDERLLRRAPPARDSPARAPEDAPPSARSQAQAGRGQAQPPAPRGSPPAPPAQASGPQAARRTPPPKASAPAPPERQSPAPQAAAPAPPQPKGPAPQPSPPRSQAQPQPHPPHQPQPQPPPQAQPAQGRGAGAGRPPSPAQRLAAPPQPQPSGKGSGGQQQAPPKPPHASSATRPSPPASAAPPASVTPPTGREAQAAAASPAAAPQPRVSDPSPSARPPRRPAPLPTSPLSLARAPPRRRRPALPLSAAPAATPAPARAPQRRSPRPRTLSESKPPPAPDAPAPAEAAPPADEPAAVLPLAEALAPPPLEPHAALVRQREVLPALRRRFSYALLVTGLGEVPRGAASAFAAALSRFLFSGMDLLVEFRRPDARAAAERRLYAGLAARYYCQTLRCGRLRHLHLSERLPHPAPPLPEPVAGLPFPCAPASTPARPLPPRAVARAAALLEGGAPPEEDEERVALAPVAGIARAILDALRLSPAVRELLAAPAAGEEPAGAVPAFLPLLRGAAEHPEEPLPAALVDAAAAAASELAACSLLPQRPGEPPALADLADPILEALEGLAPPLAGALDTRFAVSAACGECGAIGGEDPHSARLLHLPVSSLLDELPGLRLERVLARVASWELRKCPVAECPGTAGPATALLRAPPALLLATAWDVPAILEQVQLMLSWLPAGLDLGQAFAGGPGLERPAPYALRAVSCYREASATVFHAPDGPAGPWEVRPDDGSPPSELPSFGAVVQEILGRQLLPDLLWYEQQAALAGVPAEAVGPVPPHLVYEIPPGVPFYPIPVPVAVHLAYPVPMAYSPVQEGEALQPPVGEPLPTPPAPDTPPPGDVQLA
eukprot:tig00001224_g7634.t1